ncbi:GNAT family N-acetyltransferase [Lactococcus taiwanensis]|uniref:GNAT family N-acetyltransferase n=1 Tax=Lactococcus taiwanensis TaxID=1151742 RepID=A0AA45KEN6_9LACT|nr:GNAT family N-acetyltransferase [Lactococcus taiwanensis]KZK39082.1 ElaA protein [Lactococcus cremoris]QSE75877.1 GNAT family N-acetyltransferase [Lactococcus taiwanensis]
MENWKLKTFDQLTTTEMYNLLSLRTAVFVVEQNCPYQELDGKDQVAQHLWLENEAGEVVALCRLLPQGFSFAEASIGRVLVNPAYRGENWGRALVKAALEVLQQAGEDAVTIEAQYYLRDFYRGFGFVENSEPFDEDGIKHVNMKLIF